MESPAPRFTDQSDFQAYLRTEGKGVPKQTVIPIILAAAEKLAERYCRRRFAPEPTMSDAYTRQVVQISGQVGSSVPPQVTGSLGIAFNGSAETVLPLPITAAQLRAAFLALSTVGAGNAVCSGGPLPAYPISATFAGALTGEQPLIAADSSGLSGGYAVVQDAGFDSRPPVARRLTTGGKMQVRVPDLRSVDAAPDPRIPGSGGVVLYGRRLLPAQYDLGYGSYASAGADEAIGFGDYAEPSTEIRLGYGYATGVSLAAQFAFVLPLGFYPNDLTITGRWGWATPPPEIVDAVYAIGARRWAERNAFFSDQMVTPEGISLAFFKTLPSGARAALDTYRIPNIGLV